MEKSSIRILIRESVRQPLISEHCRWGSGVQRSELERLGRRLLVSLWRARRSDLISADAILDTTRVSVAHKLLDEVVPLLAHTAQGTAQVVRVVRERHADDLKGQTLDAISGRATSAVGRRVGATGEALTPAEVRDIAATLAASLKTFPPVLAREEFIERYEGAWDDDWASRGILNLAAYPPSRLQLGSDHRPPLSLPKGMAETDRLGTDRSIYGRYRSYRALPSSGRVPFRSRARTCIQPVTPKVVARDVAREEVRRATMPFGLECGPHRALLDHIYAGLSLKPLDPAFEGMDLRGQCLTLSTAHRDHVIRTVHSVVNHQVHRVPIESLAETPRELAEEGLTRQARGFTRDGLDAQWDRVEEVVMRRVWKALHGIELYVEETACSCCVVTWVKCAVACALPFALAHWFDTESAWVPPVSTGHEPHDGRAASAVHQQLGHLLDLQNATVALLADHPAEALLMILRQPGWEDVYAELTREVPEQYLPPDEFEDFCRHLAPGTESEDPS